jgi:hypothetical protein
MEASDLGEVAALAPPQVIDEPALECFLGQVEEAVALLSGATFAQKIHLEREIEDDREASGQVSHLPDLAIRKDHLLDAFIYGIHLHLTEMLCAQLGPYGGPARSLASTHLSSRASARTIDSTPALTAGSD